MEDKDKDKETDHLKVMGYLLFGLGISVFSSQIQNLNNVEWEALVGFFGLVVGSWVLGEVNK